MNNSASDQPGTSANGEESRVRVFDLHADTIGLQLRSDSALWSGLFAQHRDMRKKVPRRSR